MMTNIEQDRLREAHEDSQPWYRWGPYLAERQWATVREDYCADGNAWNFFPHEHARSRTYRWGEDGLLGISDDQGLLCFALGLWNEADPILKERLFGLTNSEGNHGEDVKEYYFFLDNTPTHSFMKALYKYPQRAFPYNDLVSTNRNWSRQEPEYELIDTGVFAEDRYFDVSVEYAKEVAVLREDARVDQFVFGFLATPIAIGGDKVVIGKRTLWIFIERLHKRVGRRVVEKEVVFLHILPVVAFRVCQTKEPFFEDGISLVPQAQCKTQQALIITDP